MPVPTRRLAAVALAVAAVRLVLPDGLPGGLLLLDGIVLAVAVADWALAVAPGRIDIERHLPAVLVLGRRGELTWQVTNTGRRRVVVDVADELAPSLRAGTRRARVVLAPRASASVTTTIEPARRGRFRPTQVVVRVRGPLGLAARQRSRQVPGLLRVQPPFASKQEAELKINKARLLEVGLRSAQGRGGGTDFEQLREWGPDDEFRRVDWSATARSGKPIVRTYRAERNQNVLILLDSGRLMAGRVADVPRLEHAMDAALLLTTVATRLGDRCGLLVFDDEVRRVVEPSHGRAQTGVVTDVLFDLEPQLVESDYREVFTQVVRRYRRRVLLVLLTELSEQAADELLIPALPLIARSHVVVVGAARDPDVERWAAEPAEDAGDVHRRAAALAALAERARLSARLRAFGVTVVDAAPGRLAPELGDAYLKLKATGRL